MTKTKLGIAGLGLIGSSILKGLNGESDYEIFCHSVSSYKTALKYCKNASDNLEVLKECDFVFVCSKASKTLEYLERLDLILKPGAVVSDVCSIKKDLLNKKYNFEFILSHPMAGTEKTGFDAGDKDLFRGAKWLVEKDNPVLNGIIKKLGAISKKIDMKDHDKYCAQISHFPTILSFLLFDCASNEAKQIASSGFRDTTRLAITNSDLALMMFNQNLENIETSLNELKTRFDKIKRMSDDEKIDLFNKISKQRKEMYDENGKNIFGI